MTPPGCLWALPPFLVGVLIGWLSPLWATGGFLMNVSLVLRIIALICFVFGAFGFNPTPVAMVPLGLAFWVGSTFP